MDYSLWAQARVRALRHQLRPEIAPVRAQVLPPDKLGCFALDRDGKLGGASLLAVGDVPKVPEGGSAPPSESVPASVVQPSDVVGKGYGSSHSTDYTIPCSPCQHQIVPAVVSDGVVSEDKGIRLANLRRLGYDANALSSRVGGRYTYWRDMLKGEKSFGEKIARKIEEKLDLPRGWLDRSAARTEEGPSEQARELGEYLDTHFRPEEREARMNQAIGFLMQIQLAELHAASPKPQPEPKLQKHPAQSPAGTSTPRKRGKKAPARS